MSPRFTAHDQPNIRYIRSKATRQHFAHLIISQFDHAMGFALWGFLRMLLKHRALLRYHIDRIVFNSTQEQVIGANTGRIIARMANEQIARNWTIVKRPRHTMGIFRHAVTNANLSVSARLRACPNPAHVGFLDFCPKALFKRRALGVGASRGVVAVGVTATLTAFCGRIIHAGSSLVAIGHASGCLQQRGGFALLHYNIDLAH